MVLAREAQEHRNTASDPFTRRRCAPTLVTKTPQVAASADLLRELQHERRAAEAAAAMKKHLDEQRLLAEQNKSSTTTTIITQTTTDKTTDKTLSEKSFTTMTTGERGSFTAFSEHNDEMFTSHDFELDLNIKLFPD
ncbi:unnamed protein product [Rotaria sordida]|uniref:Uncharacterized protein n=1 Tax=Rotaria sordida TaxID=392033 RepID=A0A815BS52_9BILA|nr:unnamed protein product [Rotaria sordida]CAF4126495.1 unnamed protein product [Rotaria sordida]